MEINLPSLAKQQRFVFHEKSIQILTDNLNAKTHSPQDEINETDYPDTHRKVKNEGWEPPHPDVVGAYFRQFQACFPEYGTDRLLAELLGLSSNRRVREFKQGTNSVPYEIWRKFLVITGREPQEIIRVMGYL